MLCLLIEAKANENYVLIYIMPVAIFTNQIICLSFQNCGKHVKLWLRKLFISMNFHWALCKARQFNNLLKYFWVESTTIIAQ